MKTQLFTRVAALFSALHFDSCLQSPDSLRATNIVPLQRVCIMHTMWQGPTQ